MINDMNIADNYRHIEGPYQNCEGEKIENQILIAGGFDLYTHHYFNPQPSNGCKKVSYCTRVKWTHLSLVPQHEKAMETAKIAVFRPFGAYKA